MAGSCRGAMAAVAALVAAAPAGAQQKVVPPDTVYWMSASTQTGLPFSPVGAAPSPADMMRMALGGGAGGPVRLLQLDLGSRRAPKGAPEAAHAIPPAMRMGASLPLVTPRRPPPPPPVDGEEPDFERPKGRLLLFWGCGETARPGQPVVIDFAKLAAGQIPPGLFAGERVRVARPPAPGRWPVTGHWPNETQDGRRSVPAGASLVGEHRVSGSYPPEIRFALQQDWMAPVALRQTQQPGGALMLTWNAVPAATGHFAQMMGGSDGGRGREPTVVFWSSSEAQTFLSGLIDFIAPAEAQRLVAAKQLMPPSQTSCAIPREAMRAAEGGLISFVAHGPEVNIIHPPRPADPRQPWVQEWAVKARFASRASAIAGIEPDGMGALGDEARAGSGRPRCTPRASGADAVVGAALGGLLGGRRRPAQQAEDCED